MLSHQFDHDMFCDKVALGAALQYPKIRTAVIFRVPGAYLSDMCVENKVFQLMCHDTLITSPFLGLCLISGLRAFSEMASYQLFFL
jgi:hypothetical protein